MIGGYEINYDVNREFFDNMEKVQVALDKKIKNIDTDCDVCEGRGFYIYIDKSKLM